MSRRFLNLMIQRCIGRHPATSLHRINPWRCFYPTTQQALAAADAPANNKAIMEDARLPRAAISFYEPYTPDTFDDVYYMSLGGGSNDIMATDGEGNTFLYDAAARAVRVMPKPHSPKVCPVSLAVGDGLYILNRNPDTEEYPFEVLIHCPRGESGDCFQEQWYWRSLPPPPYAFDHFEYGQVGKENGQEHRKSCYQDNGPDPYVIGAYTVVGDSEIWISTEGGGTFSFDTTSGVWSKAGKWALPFYGRVEYAPEHGLWFGISSQGRQFAASDLGAVSATRPPVLKKVWDELPQPLPKRWVPVKSYLLPLGSGKFCIARMFDLAEEGWALEKKGNVFHAVESFVVFTGVEVERGSRGALRMIKHKSRRYDLDRMLAHILSDRPMCCRR